MTKFMRLVSVFFGLSWLLITPCFSAVTPLSGVVSISVGTDFSCAVRNDGTVWCWGSNDAGQLGVATPPLADGLRIALNPVRLPTLSNATTVTSGWAHSCVLRSDGTVWCWGVNSGGQLGNGLRVDSPIPVKVVGLPATKAIHLGATSSCAVSQSDQVWCWGDLYSSGSGLLAGPRSDAQLSIPTLLTSLSGVRSVALGVTEACAVLLNGQAYCWGDSSNGRIGDGGSTFYPITPQRVSGLNDAESIAIGKGVCAVRRTGTVSCWGEYPPVANVEAGLQASVPTDINIGESVTTIFSGRAYCASTLEGKIVCWGSSTANFGAGDNAQPYVEIKGTVAPLLGGSVLTLAMGRTHACALMADTQVKCWGDPLGLGVGRILYSGSNYPLRVLANGISASVYAWVVSDPNALPDVTLSSADDIVVFASIEGVKPTGTVDFTDDALTRICSALPVALRSTKYELATSPTGPDLYVARCAVPRAIRLPGTYKWKAHYSGDSNHTTADSAAAIKLESGPARFRDMIEFRNVPLDYYFMTSRQNEIDLLDAAASNGWIRTGFKFRVAAKLPATMNSYFETKPLARFYFDKVALGQSRGSHFYTMSEADRTVLHGQNPQNLLLPGKPFDEGTDSFVFSVLPRSNSCGYSGFQSVFRLFRTKADDPNHRYTTDSAVVDSFVVAGWRLERTAFCALP